MGASGRHSVYVFGGLRLELGGCETAPPAAQKARLLLGALAVEGRELGRSELAGRLWPSVREESARASLRTALAQVRAALGPAADEVLVAGRSGGVALADSVWTDIGEARRLLAERRPEEALEICAHGELLAGLDDDWIHQHRDDLRGRLVEALEAAAAAADGAGERDLALRLSRRAAELAPVSETVQRGLITRLAGAGDRGAALAAYEGLRERLAAELQAAPSAATRALAEEVRAGASAPAGSGGEGPTPTSRVRYARSGDRAIAYQRFGSGNHDLVVVPGWASNLDEIWAFPPLGGLLSRLGERVRGVVFDKRGTGLSDRDMSFGSLEERAEDIRAVMDAAGLARAPVFGFSESAALACVFAAAHPERVSRLILYSSYARLRRAPDYPAGLPSELVDAFVERIRSDWGGGTISRVSFQGIPADPAMERVLGRWERSLCTPTMAAHIIRSNADIDIRSLLAGVTAPALVLHSSADPIAPTALGRYVSDAIPGARYVERDAHYHLPWDGASAWFLDEIAAFLLAEPEPPDDERHATFLSTVVCARALPADRRGAAEAAVRSHGGDLVRAGDGALAATFASPSRGVACAGALRDLGEQAAVGVHTGELRRAGGTVAGAALDVAEAVAERAGAGDVIVSRTARDLTAGSGFRFAEHGPPMPAPTGEQWDLFAYHGAG